MPLIVGDRILLSSNDLTTCLCDPQIAEFIAAATPEATCEALVLAALQGLARPTMYLSSPSPRSRGDAMRDGALTGPIIVTIGLVVAVVGALLQTASTSSKSMIERAETGMARLREEINRLGTALSSSPLYS